MSIRTGIFGACYICGKEGEKFSSYAYLCDKHAKLWQKRHHEVFTFWNTNPQLITNDDWNREFNRWADEQIIQKKEKVMFT